MNDVFAKLWKPFFQLLPHHPYILKQCRHYCDAYLGENEGDMKDNGELHFVRQHIKDCRVIFDVGANEGNWTLEVLRLRSDVQIHCFEPSPSIFEVLYDRVNTKQVRLVQRGLCSAIGTKSFYRDIYSLHERTGDQHVDQRNSNIETVSLTTLTDYMTSEQIQTVDLLKMDVEGHELSVVKGGNRMFDAGRVKRVYFEYNTTFIDAGVFLKDVFMQFEDRDYRIYKLMPDHVQRIEAYDKRLENFQFKHFGLVHTSIPETGDVRPLEL